MNFLGKVGIGPVNKRLNFGGDPDQASPLPSLVPGWAIVTVYCIVSQLEIWTDCKKFRSFGTCCSTVALVGECHGRSTPQEAVTAEKSGGVVEAEDRCGVLPHSQTICYFSTPPEIYLRQRSALQLPSNL